MPALLRLPSGLWPEAAGEGSPCWKALPVSRDVGLTGGCRCEKSDEECGEMTPDIGESPSRLLNASDAMLNRQD